MSSTSSRIHRGNTVETSPFQCGALSSHAAPSAGGPAPYVPPAGLGNHQPTSEEREAEAQRLSKEGYRKGFSDGEAGGRKQAMAQLEAAIGRLARTIEELSGMRERLRHEAEADVVGLALAVARRVLHRELTIAPEALLGLVKAALEKIDSREIHRVRTHAAHVALLQQKLEEIGVPRRIEVAADPSLEPGAAIFETAHGSLDASVETQLAEIERGFADLIRKTP